MRGNTGEFPLLSEYGVVLDLWRVGFAAEKVFDAHSDPRSMD